MVRKKKIPLILDTDIGNDIDDSWALALLLKSPEVELKYILTTTGDTEYRARIIGKMLEAVGRKDIPIGIGRKTRDWGRRLKNWVEGFELNSYAGPIHANGTRQMAETIAGLDEATILCIGPMTNIADALKMNPSIAKKCHLVAMSGSISRHEEGKDGQIAEWNVRKDIDAARKVYSAPWKSIRIAPLDSCGNLRLEKSFVRKVKASKCPLIRSLIKSTDCWAEVKRDKNWPERSPILFDVAAAYLCVSQDFLKMKQMKISIDKEGFMRFGRKNSTSVDCAVDWLDCAGFKEFLTERLTAPLF